MHSIDGATRLFAVLGHPVAHTLSPQMHNAAFLAAGKNAVYVPLDVPPARFEEALEGLHAAGFQGLNVTLPHKEEAFRRLQSSTPEARAAAAANTLRRLDAGWEGHATDGVALIACLHAMKLLPDGIRALLVGAGGAARSVAAALAAAGAAEVLLVNRSGARAQAVAAAIQASRPGARTLAASLEDAESSKISGGAYDLLIRAVSTEVVPASELKWWAKLGPGAVVLDLNYGDRALEARATAARLGIPFEDGADLLLEQGALSYEFWTGEAAPRDAMRRALKTEVA